MVATNGSGPGLVEAHRAAATGSFPRAGDEIAGYRILRVLSATDHGAVCVAIDDEASSSSELLLRVASDESGRTAIEREVATLDRVQHGHVLRLVDVAITPGGCSVAVFEYLARGSLASLLERRPVLHAGEAVTVLVSVLRGIDGLHRNGVAHSSIDETRVLLDAAGRPVLIGLGSALELNDQDVEDREFAEDFRRFAGLAERVLARTETEGREAECARALSWLQRSSPLEIGEEYASVAERFLLSISPPAPIRREKDPALPVDDSALLARVRNGRAPRSPSRPSEAPRGRTGRIRAAQSRSARAGRDVSARREGHLRALLERHLPEFELWERVVDGEAIGELRRRLLAFAGAHRRQVLFGTVAGGVLLITTLTVFPGGTPGADGVVTGSRPEPSAISEHAPRAESPVRGPASAAATSTGSATASGQPTGASSESTAESRASTSEAVDPVRAVAALMKKRKTCLGGSSLECFDRTDQVGSPLWKADRERVGSGGRISPATPPGSVSAAGAGGVARCAEGADCAASLIDRMGGTVTVALTPKSGADDAGNTGYAKPASILLVETEAGWRLREIFEN